MGDQKYAFEEIGWVDREEVARQYPSYEAVYKPLEELVLQMRAERKSDADIGNALFNLLGNITAVMRLKDAEIAGIANAFVRFTISARDKHKNTAAH